MFFKLFNAVFPNLDAIAQWTCSTDYRWHSWIILVQISVSRKLWKTTDYHYWIHVYNRSTIFKTESSVEIVARLLFNKRNVSVHKIQNWKKNKWNEMLVSLAEKWLLVRVPCSAKRLGSNGWTTSYGCHGWWHHPPPLSRFWTGTTFPVCLCFMYFNLLTLSHQQNPCVQL